MKKLFVVFVSLAFASFTYAQELPSDVEKVYKAAEHYKSKKELNQAVDAYKEVLRSVNHVPSMASIGDIEMDMRQPPNYRMAYEYYDKAIKELERGVAATAKNREKKQLSEQRDELVPKRNKAKSFVDDFDNAKDLKQGGNRLMDDEE